MSDIPKTQKAVVFDTNGGELQYKDIPVPVPKDDEILVNVKYSGVCHTDLHAWKGDWPLQCKLPLVGGHEGAGVVVALGKNVDNFKIGDYAGLKWLNGSCQSCEFCMRGNEPNCPKADLSGYTHDGSFQQYATGQAVQAAQISKGSDLAEAAPILCAGVTVYKALKQSEAKPGHWVAITGAGGGLGTLAIQYARAMGLRVVAIDTSDDKRSATLKLGAEAFVDFRTSKDIAAEVNDITAGGAHSVIHLAPSEAAIEGSVEYTRPVGTIVLVGLPAKAYAKSPVFTHVIKSISIKGSYVGNRADTQEALDFFDRGLVKSPIKIVGLSQLPQVYKEMEAGTVIGRYVLDLSK